MSHICDDNANRRTRTINETEAVLNHADNEETFHYRIQGRSILSTSKPISTFETVDHEEVVATVEVVKENNVTENMEDTRPLTENVEFDE